MFQITKFTPSDRIYPIECTCIRIEDILWPRQILRAVKVRAIRWGKEPCSFGQMTQALNCIELSAINNDTNIRLSASFGFSLPSILYRYLYIARCYTCIIYWVRLGKVIVLRRISDYGYILGKETQKQHKLMSKYSIFLTFWPSKSPIAQLDAGPVPGLWEWPSRKTFSTWIMCLFLISRWRVVGRTSEVNGLWSQDPLTFVDNPCETDQAVSYTKYMCRVFFFFVFCFFFFDPPTLLDNPRETGQPIRNFQHDVTAWIGWQRSHHGHPLLTRQKRCFYKSQLLTWAHIFVLF